MPIRLKQREDDVLGRDPGMQPAFDANFEGLRASLKQGLGRENVLDLGRADAEGERAEGAVGRRVRVAAHDRHARLGQPQLRTDDVHDPLVRRADPVQRDPEVARVLLHARDLPRGDLVDDRQDAIGGRDRMVERCDRLARAANREPALAQAVERLRARDLVHEMEVNADHVGGTVGAGGDDVVVPDLLDDRLRDWGAHRFLRR